MYKEHDFNEWTPKILHICSSLVCCTFSCIRTRRCKCIMPLVLTERHSGRKGIFYTSSKILPQERFCIQNVLYNTKLKALDGLIIFGGQRKIVRFQETKPTELYKNSLSPSFPSKLRMNSLFP